MKLAAHVICLALLLPPLRPAQAQTAPPVNARALKALVQAAEASHSDALVVLQHGRLLGQWQFGRAEEPIEAMSVTKSVVSMAIGALLQEGQLASLDEPVYRFYPEWKQGRKQAITLRHLLTHTSGLQNYPRTDVEIYPSPDFVQLALAAELADAPGTRFAYNNKALNLLAGVVQKASGQRLDEYLRAGLFRQLGISDFTWTLDAAGNPHGMSGLQIRPADLARLGQLMLQQGRWQERQLLSPAWVAAATRPDAAGSPVYGLLWWLLPETTTFVVDEAQLRLLEGAGVPAEFVAQARALQGTYTGQEAFGAALARQFGPGWMRPVQEQLAPRGLSLARKTYGPLIGYCAQGDLGQYLVVCPQQGLVAVRMVRATEAYQEATDGFPDFAQRVAALTAASPAAARRGR